MRCSVVIPLYNKVEFIGQTLQSVLHQTYSAHEIIVVDDGSSDGGDAAVTSLCDPRIRLVRQENAGVSAARNRGIDEATGDLVAFLDADDWWHPQHLATIVDMVCRYPRYEVFATRYRRVATADFPGGGWSDPLPAGEYVIEDCVPEWFGAPPFCTCTVAVRRPLAASLQPCFPHGESYGEDLDFHFRINERSAFVVSNACTCAYRVGTEGSLSRNWRVVMVAPFVERLEQRIRSGITPERLRASRRRFALKARINGVRRGVIVGARSDALLLLLTTLPAGLAYRSFWVAAAMLLLAPSGWVLRWEQWRRSIPR